MKDLINDQLSQLHNSVAWMGPYASQRAQVTQAIEVEKNNKMLLEINKRLNNTNIELENAKQSLYAMLEQQAEANRIQKETNEILLKQVEQLERRNKQLEEDNHAQSLALEKERRFSRISYWITTLIAISGVIISIIELLSK